MAEFDFSALSVADTELPAIERGRTSQLAENPFIPWVQESYTNSKGKAVKVPNAQVSRTEYLIRKAAESLGIGVRVVVSLTKEEREKAGPTKHVTVSFQGQKKRAYAPRPRKNATAETPADITAEPTGEAAGDNAPETAGN